ncbi:MAG: ABC transporter substrate-binding protein [Rhizobiaceae bacterium]|nr:ABC transporter substrate-binding protein [Rhizobiaceae bacterium]
MKSILASSGIAALALAAAIGLAPGSALAADPGITDTTIKIGMMGSLTGPAAMWGWPTINGAKMVYDKVNEEGGINGRKIEVVVEDDQCQAPLALAAAKKLLSRDEVFMLHGGSCSGAVLPVREVALKEKIPMMVLVATADEIVAQPNGYIFRAFLPGSYDGKIIADFLATAPNVKKVIAVGNTDAIANVRYPVLEESLKARDLEYLGLEPIEVEATDATAQVLKVKSQNPDAIVLVARPEASAVFLKDAAKLGLDVPIVGATVVDLQDLLDRVGDPKPMEHMHVVSFYKSPLDGEPMAPWVDMLKKYYPDDKVQAAAFYGTSGALAVVEALKRAGPDLTREGFVKAMSDIKGLDGGPMACTLNFATDDHEGCKSGSVWGMRDGKVTAIGDSWK